MAEENQAKEANVFEKLSGEHILEKHRLESFKSWPFSEKTNCSKSKMAEAGWYWTGTKKEPDTATCFLCKKTLDGWEESDDPWKEHAKHAPQCLFVKQGKPENKLNVREFLDIFGAVLINKVRKDMDEEKEKILSFAKKEMEKFTH